MFLHPAPRQLDRVSYTVAHEYHHEVERVASLLSRADVREDDPGAVEAAEQGSETPSLVHRAQDLRSRDGARALAEPLRAEQLAANRPGEQVVSGRRPAGQERPATAHRRPLP